VLNVTLGANKSLRRVEKIVENLKIWVGIMQISVSGCLSSQRDSVLFTLCIHVPHRDTGNLITVVVQKEISTSIFNRLSDLDVVHEIYCCAKSLILHEFNEGFYYKNKRIYDPHKEEIKDDQKRRAHYFTWT
jgi:hypothetical protein